MPFEQRPKLAGNTRSRLGLWQEAALPARMLAAKLIFGVLSASGRALPDVLGIPNISFATKLFPAEIPSGIRSEPWAGGPANEFAPEPYP